MQSTGTKGIQKEEWFGVGKVIHRKLCKRQTYDDSQKPESVQENET